MTPCTIVLAGIPNVGKTSIINRIIYDKFTSKNDSTTKHRIITERRNGIKFQFRDTDGLEKVHTLTRTYFKNGKIIFLVFAVDDRKSFDELRHLNDTIKEIEDPEIIKILIGNKSDLESKITVIDCENLQNEMGCKELFWTSAKDGDGIENLLEKVAICWKDSILDIRKSQGYSKLSDNENHLGDNVCPCCSIL